MTLVEKFESGKMDMTDTHSFFRKLLSQHMIKQESLNERQLMQSLVIYSKYIKLLNDKLKNRSIEPNSVYLKQVKDDVQKLIDSFVASQS